MAARKIFNEIGSKLMKSKSKIHSIQFFLKTKKKIYLLPYIRITHTGVGKMEKVYLLDTLNATNKKMVVCFITKNSQKKLCT